MQIRLSLLALVAVLLLGALGYVYIEDMSALDAIYTTIVVVTTIGMAVGPSVLEMSDGGKVFTIVLALTGLGVVTSAAGFLLRNLIAGQLNFMLGRRIMERQIAALKDHFIVCGYGRLGHIIAQELKGCGTPFVIVEPSDENFAQIAEDGFIGVQGDALDDETLELARVRHARGLISTVDSDADNVFLILSARQFNPGLHVVVRGESQSTISKLRRVGADVVIAPITIGGEIIAQAALRPNVMDFINITTRARHQRHQIEEVKVFDASPLAGKSLKDLQISRNHHVIVVGIKRAAEEESVFNPSGDTVIHAGDILIILGETQDVGKFKAVGRGQG